MNRPVKRVGIIMHGVTGRMGMNQHLIRSILEIRKQGGVALKDGSRLMPDPILVGRNAAKVRELAKQHGIERWTDDLDKALQAKDEIFFDAASTQLRPKLLKRAIAAGKHIYCEKPVSMTLAEAKDLYAAAVLLAVVPGRSLRGHPVALEHPVTEFAAHRQDAAEKAPVAQLRELEQPGKPELVLHHAVLDLRFFRRLV